ncbi:hypothetical protein SLS56_011205 [Neofusicoccum ribis]|uniref:Uncharacterized protein n=1 Tax=Neofusicoccum ribis TaxID=45134 RepID=A0ABR3SC77_9PEZI
MDLVTPISTRVEQLVQAVCPPDDGSYWRTPPVLLEPANPAAYQDWSWDVRPDCAYWLSLDGFNQNYSFQVDSKTYVKSDSICPYFTVEFKRTGESDEIAVNQVAASTNQAYIPSYPRLACVSNVPSLRD